MISSSESMMIQTPTINTTIIEDNTDQPVTQDVEMMDTESDTVLMTFVQQGMVNLQLNAPQMNSTSDAVVSVLEKPGTLLFNRKQPPPVPVPNGPIALPMVWTLPQASSISALTPTTTALDGKRSSKHAAMRQPDDEDDEEEEEEEEEDEEAEEQEDYKRDVARNRQSRTKSRSRQTINVPITETKYKVFKEFDQWASTQYAEQSIKLQSLTLKRLLGFSEALPDAHNGDVRDAHNGDVRETGRNRLLMVLQDGAVTERYLDAFQKGKLWTLANEIGRLIVMLEFLKATQTRSEMSVFLTNVLMVRICCLSKQRVKCKQKAIAQNADVANKFQYSELQDVFIKEKLPVLFSNTSYKMDVQPLVIASVYFLYRPLRKSVWGNLKMHDIEKIDSNELII
jgi:hypothetical protein